MIISIHRRFIFVANLKTASTSIENILRPYGDVNILWTEFGKHISLSDIEERFAWIFNVESIRKFFVFGVIRDPVEYIKSLYRSHADPKFRDDTERYTGNMNFSEFLSSWVPKNEVQVRPQIHRFLRRDGSFGLQSLIAYDDLQSGFQSVCDQLKIPISSMPRLNVSPAIDFDISKEENILIREIFADDYRFIEKTEPKI